MSVLDRLKARMVTDWRTLLSFATIRLHLAAIGIGVIYQAMPVLDPAIAGVLPAPLAAKAISFYALGGFILRAIKFKKSNA